MSRFLLVVVAAGLAAFGNRLPAADGTAAPERVAGLIENLDHPAFAQRQEASEQLEATGAAAIVELEAAAAGGSREAAARSLAILKKHLQTGDVELQRAAKEALQRLAAGSNASTAQRAREMVQPARPVVATSRLVPPPPGPQFGPQFGPLPGINLNNFRRVTVSDINGRKSVEIEDRERRVKIELPPAGNIEVEVTDKQNPAGAVRRLAAKDAADLAKIDPEMGRLFEQHLGAGARAAGGGPPLKGRNGKAGQIAIEPADAAKLQLQTVDALLKRFRERAETDPTAQRMVQSLETMRQTLQPRTR